MMDKIPYEDEYRKTLDYVYPKWLQFLCSFEMCGYITLSLLIGMYLQWFNIYDFQIKFRHLFIPIQVYLMIFPIEIIFQLLIYCYVLKKHDKNKD